MQSITSHLADLVSDVVLRSAGVTSVEALSQNVVRVELKCDSFANAAWTPGMKLQFRPARGTFQMRTYTPARWDSAQGLADIIGYIHGDGPASDWFRKVYVGDVCEVFGPRGSIDLLDIADETVFVGDESSLGLACAMHTSGSGDHYVFESTSPSAMTEVLDELGLPRHKCIVVAKSQDRNMLLQSACAAAESCRGEFDLVISGDAATVNALRRGSRQWSTPPRRVKGKAYWAKGRTGLE